MSYQCPLHIVAVALVALGATSVTSHAAAEDSSGFRYGISGNNQVFTDPELAEAGGVVTLTISGGREATIIVELVDIYADSSGEKRPLPLNSNPYTPNGLVEFPEIAGEYTPNNRPQNIDVGFRFIDIESLSRPVLGGLKISILPKVEDPGAAKVRSSIVATFGYYPSGVVGTNTFAPSLELSEVTLQRQSRDSFPFSVFPDVPRVFTGGPFHLDAKLTNSGNIFLNSRLTASVSKIGFFGRTSASPIFQQTFTDQLLVPSQSTEFSFQIGKNDATVTENVRFPRFGLARITVAAEGSIGEEQRTTTATTITVLFVPWKHLLVVGLAIILLRKRISLLFRASRSYLQDFRHFRKTRLAARERPEQRADGAQDE